MKMWKRRLAFAMAFAMTVTTVPVDSIVLAQEDIVSETAAETTVVEESAPETEAPVAEETPVVEETWAEEVPAAEETPVTEETPATEEPAGEVTSDEISTEEDAAGGQTEEAAEETEQPFAEDDLVLDGGEIVLGDPASETTTVVESEAMAPANAAIAPMSDTSIEGKEPPANATDMTLGKEYRLTLTEGEPQYFKFTPEKTTGYTYAVTEAPTEGVGVYMHVYRLDNDGCWGQGDMYPAPNERYMQLEAGKTYYLQIRTTSGATDIAFYFKASPEISEMTIEPTHEIARYLFEMDKYNALGNLQVVRTYSDGVSFKTSLQETDDYGNEPQHMWVASADSTEAVDVSTPGTYYLRVSLGEVSAVYPVEFAAPQELVEGDLNAGNDYTYTASNTWGTSAVSFTASAGGTYVFCAEGSEECRVYTDGTDLNQVSSSDSGIVSVQMAEGDTVTFAAHAVGTALKFSVRPLKEARSLHFENDQAVTSIFELHDYAKSCDVKTDYTGGDVSGLTSYWYWTTKFSLDGNYHYYKRKTYNGDDVILELHDENGVMSLPYNFEFKNLAPGNYTLKAYLENNPEISATQALTVQAVPLEATVLETGAASDPVTPHGEFYVFKVPQTARYKVGLSYNDSEMYGITLASYRVDADGQQISQEWVGQDNTVNMTDGETWIFTAPDSQNSYDDIDYSNFSIQISKQPIPESIDWGTVADSYSTFDFASDIMSASLTLVTDDGVSEAHDYRWINTVLGYQVYAENFSVGDFSICTYLQLFREGEQINVPDYGGALPEGVYTLRAVCEQGYDTNGEPILLELGEKVITATLGDEAAEALSADEEKSYELSAAGEKCFTFTAPETGVYLMKVAPEEGCNEVFLYRKTEDGFEQIGNTIVYGGEITCLTTPESSQAEETYMLRLKEGWREDSRGSVVVTRRPELLSAELTLKESFNAVKFKEELSDTSVTLHYQNKNNETIKEIIYGAAWDDIEYDDGNGNWIYGCHYQTDYGMNVELRMYDARGNAVSIPGYGGEETPIGTYVFKLFVDGQEWAVQQAEISLPQAETMVVGQEYLDASNGRTFTYVPTEETAGDYMLYLSYYDYGEEQVVYRYSEEEQRLERVASERWSNTIDMSLEAGKTYYIAVNGYRNTRFTLDKKEKLVRISMIPEAEEPEMIAGVDGYYTPMVELTYEGGMTKRVEVGENDIFGNWIEPVIYPAAPDGTADLDNPIAEYSNLEPGVYFTGARMEVDGAYITAKNPVKFKVISMLEAAQKNAFGNGTDTITLTMHEGKYTYALYTPVTDGFYKFTFDKGGACYFYDTAGEELDGDWLNGHTREIELLKDTPVILQTRVHDEDKFANSFPLTVTAEAQNEIKKVLVGADNTSLIAGLDTVSAAQLSTTVTYGDGNELTLQDMKQDAQGNGFRYKLTEEGSGDIIDIKNNYRLTSTFPEAGTYAVKAYHRTRSAIVSENSVQIEVKDVDALNLPQLSEGEAYEVWPAGERQLFTFTPERDGVYEAAFSAGTPYAVWYYKTANGLSPWYGSLKQGEKYVLYVESVSAVTKLTVQEKQATGQNQYELLYKEPLQVTANKGETVDLLFTAPRTGTYTAKITTSEDENYAYLSSMTGEVDSKRKGNGDYVLTFEATGGEPRVLQFTLSNAANGSGQYSILVEDTKQLKDIKVDAKDTDGLIAEVFKAYIPTEFLEVYGNYSDGSSELITDGNSGYSYDGYGNRLEFEFYVTELSAETVTYECEVYAAGSWEETNVTVDLTLQRGAAQARELKINETVSGTSTGGPELFLFTPEKTGYYFFTSSISGGWCQALAYYEYEEYGNIIEYDTNEQFAAGETYYVVLETDSSAVERSYELTVKESSQIVKLEAEEIPEIPLYATDVYDVPEEIKIKVTYDNGETEIISQKHSTLTGTAQTYSNWSLIRADKTTARITVTINNVRLSFDAPYAESLNLPQLIQGQEAKFDLAGAPEGAGETTVVSFTPSEDGVYMLQRTALMADGLKANPRLIDTETGRQSYVWPAKMKAGKTYVISSYVVWNEPQTITLKMVRADVENCDDGHKLTAHPGKAATCTAAGSRAYYSCEQCKKNFTDAAGTAELTGAIEIPALGHKLTYHAAKAATCTATGTVAYYSCAQCKKNFSDSKGTKPVTSITTKALGHSFGAWRTTTAATVFAPAKQTRTCSRCKKNEVRNYGSKLRATITTTANSLTMKMRQSTTRFMAAGFARGDSLASVVSGNTAIVKVSNVSARGTFKLTAQRKSGSTKLTLRTKAGAVKVVTVKVQKSTVRTAAIAGVARTATVQKGKTIVLKPVIAPVTSQESVKYKSSNRKIATVTSKGVIKGVKPGRVKIYVQSGRKKVTCTVTVLGIKNTKLTNVRTSVTIKRRKSYTLRPRRYPANSTDAITYKTSNKRIATVSSSGKIVGKKAGTAIITVTCGSAVAKCVVTVK